MKHTSPLFIALLLLSSCGGAPKDPSAPIGPASAAPAAEAAPVAEAKTDAPHAAATPVPEATCEKDADCTIFADCCSCKAVSAKAPLPESCDSICGESSCEVKGKTLANVACVAGHCKLK